MPRFAVAREGGRVEITFDDGRMNLLSSDALSELASVIVDLQSATCDLLLFRATRAAGADMSEMQRFTPRDAEAFARLGQNVFGQIERLPFATVAIIDGDCFGGALDLAMAFDLRFATPPSRFSHPGARLGIVTGFGGTSRWRRILSRPSARRLFLGNDVLSAEEAHAIGLVDVVAPSFDGELARLASLDPATTAFVKELSRHADALSRHELRLLGERLAALYRMPQ